MFGTEHYLGTGISGIIFVNQLKNFDIQVVIITNPRLEFINQDLACPFL